MNYVDIDHHRQYSLMTLMDQERQTIRSGRVLNLQAEIEKFLEGVEAGGGRFPPGLPVLKKTARAGCVAHV